EGGGKEGGEQSGGQALDRPPQPHLVGSTRDESCRPAVFSRQWFSRRERAAPVLRGYAGRRVSHAIPLSRQRCGRSRRTSHADGWLVFGRWSDWNDLRSKCG